jgi:DNA-binding winged helix-turn-helix (wHTH) protein
VAGLPQDPATIEFGRFKVVRHRRELLADGRPVELGGRAFDTLLALIDARGTVLGKDELISRVWPDRVVEENNLPAQISVLRKFFGADRHFIRTVAGRGYQFTGEIRATAATAAGPPPSRMTNVPEAVAELIGRGAELGEVMALATEHRLVSLVGAGGIGKTRLGMEVARQLLPRFPDGVFLAELGLLSSPELVVATVASALGFTHFAGTVSHEGVAAAIGRRKLLLVIDNCEHVIQAAAGMAEALLRASAGVSLLATSREPLTRPAVEWLAAYRLYVDDLRTALDWAFSPSGDVGVGVALTAATVPLWTQLSLLTECRARVEQAIAGLGRQVPGDPGRDMRLYLALGHAILHTRARGMRVQPNPTRGTYGTERPRQHA